MKRKIYILFIFALILGSCAIFKGKGYLTKITITYDTSRPINYGYTLPLTLTAYYSNGKIKEITNKDGSYIRVEGATITSNSVLKFNRYPKQFNDDNIAVYASYTKGDKTYKDSIFFSYNYRGKINLNFSGKIGPTGDSGSNGSTSLLFRFGKDGYAGNAGGQGENGHDITAYIWKDSSLYFIKVYDMNTDKYYFYKANDLTKAFNITTNGGQGGSGGEGGQGGSGKDGSIGKKIKSPGAGGNGGNGGTGGVGGKGGNIYVFVHPTAADFSNSIFGFNNGGVGGNGGSGGTGGSGGKAQEGQTAGSNGSSGVNGMRGIAGQNGDIINIEIQEFDIESN
jgi:hypothetical protein